MTLQYLQQHWALLAAGGVGTAVVLFVLWRAWLDSARGRLAVARRNLRAALVTARKRQKKARSLAATLDRLEARSQSVQPIRLQEAAEAVQDEALIAATREMLKHNPRLVRSCGWPYWKRSPAWEPIKPVTTAV